MAEMFADKKARRFKATTSNTRYGVEEVFIWLR
jgi:hypothetical protein